MGSDIANKELVKASIPALVGLRQQAAALYLASRKTRARQSGDYLSPFRGRGMEFDESRLYQPGDDVRNIDWRVTARTGKTHTKLFREERERPVLIWVDLRTAMHFATQGKYKSVVAAELAALLAWSALNNGDRIGGVIFSDEAHHELKPQRGKSAVLRLINRLVHHAIWREHPAVDTGKPALGHALLRLRRIAKPGSLIFLISDFRGMDAFAETQLSRLGKHNDVIMLFVYDPLEKALPPPGRYKISHGDKAFLLDTSDPGPVHQYQQQFKARAERLRRLATSNGLMLLVCMSNDEPCSVLLKGLTAPSRR